MKPSGIANPQAVVGTTGYTFVDDHALTEIAAIFAGLVLVVLG